MPQGLLVFGVKTTVRAHDTYNYNTSVRLYFLGFRFGFTLTGVVYEWLTLELVIVPTFSDGCT